MTDAARIEDILLREGAYATATQGASMYPMLRQGRDTVIIRPPEGRLRKYDVPLYRVGPKYVLHRVVRVLPDGYVIRGDNCLCNEHVRDAQIIGVLAGFYRTTAPWTCPVPATGCTAGSGAPSPLSGGCTAAPTARPPPSGTD